MRFRRLAPLALFFAADSAIAAIPAPDQQHYRNVDYEFSVQLPPGFLTCVSENTNHGVAILLDKMIRCNDNYYDTPVIFVEANYNAAGDADNAWGLAAIDCRRQRARHIAWLRGMRLSGRKAAGCRRDFPDGHIEVSYLVLRKTDHSFLQWVEVSADLSTTPARYRADMRIFHRVLHGIWVHPDGPMR